MPDQAWPWLLTALGVIWLWQAGSGRWWAWSIGILTECCWLVYAIVTRQYGFIVGAIVYGVAHARNLRNNWPSADTSSTNTPT